ncbi:unnamed protein product [Diplocarpon coronariae]
MSFTESQTQAQPDISYPQASRGISYGARNSTLNKSAGLINQRTFPLPTLSPILRQHAKELWSGRGSFILRVKRSQYSREDNATIYAGVSSYIGPIRGRQVSKVVDGVKQSSMLNHIKDLSQTAAAGHLGASAYTTDKKVFQNDAGDIVSLFSLGVAAKDGEKRVTIQYDRRGFTGFLHLSRSPGIQPIAEAQAEALDPLQFLGLKSSLTLNFKEGDIQYVNNLRSPMPGWLHGYRGAAVGALRLVEASVATLGETRNKPERRNRLCRADGMILMKVLRRRNRYSRLNPRFEEVLYGPVVRLGLNEVSLNSPTALKSIHGAGSGFERTSFYRMFDGHGQQKLFTFAGVKEHGERKKPLNHAYSKTSIQKPAAAAVGEKGGEFLRFLEREPQAASETFSSLHHYSLDTITHFLYGPGHHPFPLWTWYRSDKVDGGIRPGPGNSERRAGPIAAETGLKVVAYLVLLPPKKPTVYTGIRKHALQSFHKHSAVSADGHGALGSTSVTARVMQSHVSVKENGLNELEIASEVADHSLAGLDTTISALPESALDPRGVSTAAATGKLPSLGAVIRETLRLYAPLAASEPRSLPVECTIDGYRIPAKTVVSISPYTLHRNPGVSRRPLAFDPDRWLGEAKDVAQMKKCFWPFSSGGRMCIGIHLAMAEMTTLTAAIYRKHRTTVTPGTGNTSPAITSRVEVLYDETKQDLREHECYINFDAR